MQEELGHLWRAALASQRGSLAHQTPTTGVAMREDGDERTKRGGETVCATPSRLTVRWRLGWSGHQQHQLPKFAGIAAAIPMRLAPGKLLLQPLDCHGWVRHEFQLVIPAPVVPAPPAPSENQIAKKVGRKRDRVATIFSMEAQIDAQIRSH